MKFKATDVSIVIPNWNGRKLLEKYLPTVIKTSQGAQIIVSDDASTDDSVEFIRNNYPEIIVVEKKINDGFSTAVNEGVNKASGAIIVLLNTDIEPEQEYLSHLLEHFEKDSVFAVGCLDKSDEKGTYVLRGRGEAKWHKGFYIHRKGETDKQATAWVSGGSSAFRKEYWKKLGGLDPLFNPFYWEDIDLSYRARKSGYEILFDAKSIVIHHHDQGSIKSQTSTKAVTKIAYRNQLFFIWKNISDTGYILDHIFWLSIRLFQSAIIGDRLFFSAFLLAIKKLPVIITERRKNARLFTMSDSQLVSRNYS